MERDVGVAETHETLGVAVLDGPEDGEDGPRGIGKVTWIGHLDCLREFDFGSQDNRDAVLDASAFFTWRGITAAAF